MEQQITHISLLDWVINRFIPLDGCRAIAFVLAWYIVQAKTVDAGVLVQQAKTPDAGALIYLAKKPDAKALF